MKGCFFSIFFLFAVLCGGEVAAQALPSDTIAKRVMRDWGINTTEQNQIRLLKSGFAKFEDMFDAVRAAKHHIHLEYFNYRNDSIADALFEILQEKAAQGVQVRVLFDAFGNASNNQPLKKHHLAALRAAGIEIYKFKPFRFPWLSYSWGRDHSKIVVIDGQVAYMGGMNVADYYLHGTPQLGSWRDIHFRVEGPVVAELQDIFLELWRKVTRQRIAGSVYYPGPTLENNLPYQDVELSIVNREPYESNAIMRKAYVAAIRSAQEHIRIINPYFVPTHSVRKALMRAQARGVELQLMLSQQGDIPLIPITSRYYANRLIKRGATVYLYLPGFHHSKIMMVDDKFCTIGSANLNSRSLRYDYEVNAFIYNEAVTADLTRMFEADKCDAVPYTWVVWKSYSPWKRFVGWFGNLLTPFL